MTNLKYRLPFAVFAGLLALSMPSFADQWDKKTIITIGSPMQMPTTTLQPGTYTLKLLDSTSNRHIVTVWDRDGMRLVTTVLATPNYRLQPTGKSAFSFWETPAGQPPALRAWFYPGDNFGQEFAYPKAKAQEIAMLNHGVQPPALSDPGFSQREEIQPSAEPAPPAAPEQHEATPEPVAVASAAPATAEPAPSPEPAAPVAAATTAPEPPAPPPAAAAEEPQTPTASEGSSTSSLPQTGTAWYTLLFIGVTAAVTGLSTFGFGKKKPYVDSSDD